MDKKLKEFFRLKATAKKTDARIKILKAELEAQLKPGDEIKKDYGTFQVVKSSTIWKFSDELNKEIEELECRKIDEQESGKAVSTVGYGLKFNFAKVK